MLKFCPTVCVRVCRCVWVVFVWGRAGTKYRPKGRSHWPGQCNSTSCTYVHVFCKKFIGTPSVLWHLFQFRCSDVRQEGQTDGWKDGRTDLHCWPHTHECTQIHTPTCDYCLLLDACLFVCVARFVCVVAPVARPPARGPFSNAFKADARGFFHRETAMATLVINATTLIPTAWPRKSRGS